MFEFRCFNLLVACIGIFPNIETAAIKLPSDVINDSIKVLDILIEKSEESEDMIGHGGALTDFFHSDQSVEENDADLVVKEESDINHQVFEEESRYDHKVFLEESNIYKALEEINVDQALEEEIKLEALEEDSTIDQAFKEESDMEQTSIDEGDIVQAVEEERNAYLVLNEERNKGQVLEEENFINLALAEESYIDKTSEVKSYLDKALEYESNIDQALGEESDVDQASEKSDTYPALEEDDMDQTIDFMEDIEIELMLNDAEKLYEHHADGSILKHNMVSPSPAEKESEEQEAWSIIDQDFMFQMENLNNMNDFVEALDSYVESEDAAQDRSDIIVHVGDFEDLEADESSEQTADKIQSSSNTDLNKGESYGEDESFLGQFFDFFG